MNTDTRRAHVLACIRPLIEAQGYNAVSVDAMARASGVAKATFYRIFPSKEAVRQALAGDGVAPHLLDARDGREAIIHAAMIVFARDGYARATIDAIATAAGMSKAGLYWHFASKEAVFAAIIEAFNPFEALAAAIAAGEAAGNDVEDVLTTALTAVLRDLVPRRDLFRVIFFEITTDPALAPVFDQFVVRQALPVLGQYLGRQIAAGILRPVAPIVAAHALIGPLYFYLLTRDRQEALLGGVPSVAEIVAYITHTFVEGNRVRPHLQTDAHEPHAAHP